MAGDRWVFTKSQLVNTPSRKCGIDSDKELSFRQQAASLIQEMGQRLQVPQLCINTAIVYMHRFYMVQSFQKFHQNQIAAASLFLAAKVEEQPRKLEHMIKVAHHCIHRDGTTLDIKSDGYLEQAQELVINENILLQTLGFDITVDHPHTNVVKTCQMVRASKDLAQTSYFLATNSLHLTVLCLQYKPTVVACVCVHLACKWSNWELPKSSEGKEWYTYVDKSVTLDLLEELTQDFLNILDKCPSKLRKKIMTWKSGKHEGLLGKDDEALLSKVKSVADAAAASAASASSASTSNQTSNALKSTSARHSNERKNANHSTTSSTQVKVETSCQSAVQPVTGGSQPEGSMPSSVAAKTQALAETLKRVKAESTIVTMSQYKERKEKELLVKKDKTSDKDSHRKDQNKFAEQGIKIHIKTERDSSSDRKSHRKYTPDSGSGSDTKYHIKKEPGSQHDTLSPLKIKVEPGAPISPLKMKIKTGTVEMQKDMTSPLKMKIKPYPKIADKNQNHSAHHSNAEKSDRQSSHHTSKHPSSSHSSGTHERQSLKIKLPKPGAQKHPGREDSHSRSGTNGKMEKNRSSHRQAPEMNSHGHRPSSKDLDRQGSMSKHLTHTVSTPDLISYASSNTTSSRKRPNSPAAGNISDSSGPKNKVAKCDGPPHTLARSSSSHSIHSMDLSDTGSIGDTLGEAEQMARGFDSNESGTNSPVVESKSVINQQLVQLQHIINRQKSQIAHLKQQTPQQLQHQQSLFDLDFIGDITNPPLPNESPLRPPTPPLPPSGARSPNLMLQYPSYPPPPPPAPF
ncbi:hypothetical protein ScPMuIL_011754 [Solemya velum]